MAVGDAYGATEWRERDGDDEIAFRTERISRNVCRLVSEYAFVHARRTHSKVFGGPKYTVSPVYEGLLKEEMDAAAARYPDVVYEPQLIDATYALLDLERGRRDGHPLAQPRRRLSLRSRDATLRIDRGGGERAHGLRSIAQAVVRHGRSASRTAPRLFGKNVANPMAMILAEAALLAHVGDPRGPSASRAIYESVLEAVHGGVATSDLGGHASTSEFTNAVIAKVKSKLDVWATL